MNILILPGLPLGSGLPALGMPIELFAEARPCFAMSGMAWGGLAELVASLFEVAEAPILPAGTVAVVARGPIVRA